MYGKFNQFREAEEVSCIVSNATQKNILFEYDKDTSLVRYRAIGDRRTAPVPVGLFDNMNTHDIADHVTSVFQTGR